MIHAPLVAPVPLEAVDHPDVLAALPAFGGISPGWWGALPWTFERDGTALILHLDQLRDERLGDRANCDLLMACGGVIENLRVAAHHFGGALQVALWPDQRDDTVVARLTVQALTVPREEEEALYRILAPVARGGTDRAAGGVSPALLAVLRHAARSHGAWFDVIGDDPRRQILADLEAQASAIADAERCVRRVLSATRSPDVLAMGGAPSLGDLFGTLGANVQPSKAWITGHSGGMRRSVLTAPLLAVLGANGDVPAEWVRSGMALQRVLLHASVQRLTASFLNAPLRHPLLRDAVQSILFANGVPQVIVRFDVEMERAMFESIRQRTHGDVTG